MTFRLERKLFEDFVANIRVPRVAIGYPRIQDFDLGGVVVDCLPVGVSQLVIRNSLLRSQGMS